MYGFLGVAIMFSSCKILNSTGLEPYCPRPRAYTDGYMIRCSKYNHTPLFHDRNWASSRGVIIAASKCTKKGRGYQFTFDKEGK